MIQRQINIIIYQTNIFDIFLETPYKAYKYTK